MKDINVEDMVGIDLGITKVIHDSEGRAFAPLDEQADREASRNGIARSLTNNTNHATVTRLVNGW